jgi:hypothetical protein
METISNWLTLDKGRLLCINEENNVEYLNLMVLPWLDFLHPRSSYLTLQYQNLSLRVSINRNHL